MKRILIILALVSVKFGYCQLPCEDFCLDFDNTQCLSQLSIDTITFPGNIWQIGMPQKPLFDSVSSNYNPNAIITDTLNPYPIKILTPIMDRCKAKLSIESAETV